MAFREWRRDCCDEGTDLAAKLLAEFKRGEIEKARIPAYMLHYAVMFANKAMPKARKFQQLI